MKKLMKLALCFLMIFSICACSSNKEESKKHKKKISATAVDNVLKPYKLERLDYDEEYNMATMTIDKGKYHFTINHKIDSSPSDLLNYVSFYQNDNSDDALSVYGVYQKNYKDYKKYNKDNKKMLKKFENFLNKYDLTYDELYRWFQNLALDDNDISLH